MSKRIEWVDSAKGILIFLVILGHATTLSVIKLLT